MAFKEPYPFDLSDLRQLPSKLFLSRFKIFVAVGPPNVYHVLQDYYFQSLAFVLNVLVP